MSGFDHHGAIVVTFAHYFFGFVGGEASAFGFFEEEVAKGVDVFLIGAGVNDGDVGDVEFVFVNDLLDALSVAEEDGFGNAFFFDLLCGFEDFVVVGFGKDNALWVLSCSGNDGAYEFVVEVESFFEVFDILVPVVDVDLRHTRLYGSASHSGGYGVDESGVEGFGDDVFGTELEVFGVVGQVDHFGYGLPRQLCNGVYGSEFHVFVDFGGSDIEGTAEDEGEADDVVDLVGEVAASGGHDDILPGGFGIGVGDFGVGVGHGKDNGVGGHGLEHGSIEDVAFAEAYEHIGTLHGLFEGVDVFGGGKFFFVVVKVVAVGANDTGAVEHDDVAFVGTQRHEEFGAGDGGSASAIDYDVDVLDFFANDVEGVDECSPADDGCAMLVVMHDGDVELFFESFFDFETFGGFDVFEVDATEGGRNGFDGFYKIVNIGLVDFDVEHVNVGKYFEEESFAFHDGFGGFGSNVAETEYGSAV